MEQQNPSIATPTGAAYLHIVGVGFWTAQVGVEIGLLKPTDRAALVKQAMTDAFEVHFKENIPRRFEPAYALFNLGYRIEAKTRKKKDRAANRGRPSQDADLPNVWTGATRQAAKQSYLVTRSIGGAKNGVVGGTMIMPLPSYLNQQRSNFTPDGAGITPTTLRKITKDEGERIAREFFKALANYVLRVQLEFTGRGKTFKVRGSIADQDRASFTFRGRATAVIQRASEVG